MLPSLKTFTLEAELKGHLRTLYSVLCGHKIYHPQWRVSDQKMDQEQLRGHRACVGAVVGNEEK